jgi:hypothetical protein
MEKGWLKTIIDRALADRETWPAWQRGAEIETRNESIVLKSEDHQEETTGDRKAAA